MSRSPVAWAGLAVSVPSSGPLTAAVARAVRTVRRLAGFMISIVADPGPAEKKASCAVRHRPGSPVRSRKGSSSPGTASEAKARPSEASVSCAV